MENLPDHKKCREQSPRDERLRQSVLTSEASKRQASFALDEPFFFASWITQLVVSITVRIGRKKTDEMQWTSKTSEERKEVDI